MIPSLLFVIVPKSAAVNIKEKYSLTNYLFIYLFKISTFVTYYFCLKEAVIIPYWEYFFFPYKVNSD